MFNFSIHTLLEISLRTFIVYLVVLLGVRITGKREIGQLTPFDLVFLLLISNALQNAMTGPDTSVTGGAVSALTLFLAAVLISRLFLRNRKFRRFVEGTPTVLISNGKVIQKNLEKEGLTTDELQASLREHGAFRIEDVELAVLEIDGSISVIRTDDFKEGAPIRMRHGFRFLKDKS